LAAAVLLVAGLCAADVAKADDGLALERAIKATFLSKFELYVTWPERSFASAASPFRLCVVGVDDTFADLIARAAVGQSAGGHAIVVVRLPAASGNDGCELLFIPMNDAETVRLQLAAVDRLPVLTVTDGMRDGSAKGIVNFVILNNRVRFEIDDATAVRSGLAISSKLLSLAVSVRPVP